MSQPVMSGVPQGTIPRQPHICLFANDSILYCTIPPIDDYHMLQQGLTTLQHWTNTWQMDFSVSKCTINKKHNPSVFDYNMKSQIVPWVCLKVCNHVHYQETQSISVWLQHEKSDHASGMITCLSESSCPRWSQLGQTHQQNHFKVSQSLDMLWRNLPSCPKEVNRQAYITITRSKLEYTSWAWSPHTAKGKKQLESVQNTTAHFCTSDQCRIPQLIFAPVITANGKVWATWLKI